MHSATTNETLIDRVIAILESVPLTPWWWRARRRNTERKALMKHARLYY